MTVYSDLPEKYNSVSIRAPMKGRTFRDAIALGRQAVTQRIPWTPSVLAAVEEKRQAGVPLTVIARALGCSYGSLKMARQYTHSSDQRMPEAEALSRIAQVGVTGRRADAAE